ncbi:DoxX family protein [Robiginitalea sp. SC105]|uniref:DoxX family protein n=1 Tax=Robiginitalea sp. SC105 TaxID=2762332 RepID=UPI00163A0B60|nr:DoxX family protein [Robiginitalea sp. SC105]MBC2839953.1 DoxX family protein [Robiginitalea sp. SC105]
MEAKPSNSVRLRLWTSYILQTLLAFMFLLGAVMNLMQSETAVSQAVEMGYPGASVVYLGAILLICTMLYLIPRTNILGALLLTGWLGGAVATHIIYGDPMFNILFPVLFGILVWGILWLRDGAVRMLLPLRRSEVPRAGSK